MGAGERVLDVAAGSGNADIPPALAGASVVAGDLTPELLKVGRAQAEERGAELEWRQAEAEALPFAGGEFDTVLSCVGGHVRPAQPGQRRRVGPRLPLRRNHRPAQLDLEGFVGQLFATMKPYAPPPPPSGDQEEIGTVTVTARKGIQDDATPDFIASDPSGNEIATPAVLDGIDENLPTFDAGEPGTEQGESNDCLD